MFCQACGSEGTERAKFCVKCGARMSYVDVPVQPEQPMAEADSRRDAEPRDAEAVLYVRRQIEKGKNKADISARLSATGWTSDQFEDLWRKATAGTDEGNVSAQTSVLAAHGVVGGLWGPAQAFPDVVESLAGGNWGAARQRAEELHATSPDDPEIILMLLFVRLLADGADARAHTDPTLRRLWELANLAVTTVPRSSLSHYLRSVTDLLLAYMNWPPDQQTALLAEAASDAAVSRAGEPGEVDRLLVSLLIERFDEGDGSEQGVDVLAGTKGQPCSLLGHLTMAVALQMCETTELNPEEMAGLQDETAVDFVLRQWVAADRGLGALHTLRGTPFEPELMRWLTMCPIGERPRGRAAACRRLVECLGTVQCEPMNLLPLAEAKWWLAQWLPWVDRDRSLAVCGRLADQAAESAWQYLSESASPGTIIIFSPPGGPFSEATRAGTGPISLPNGDTPVRRPHDIGCVIRIGGGWEMVEQDMTGGPRGYEVAATLLAAAVQDEGDKHRRRVPDSWTKPAGYQVFRDGFTINSTPEFIPYAAVSSITVKSGLLRTGVTVIGDDGTIIMENEPWSKAGAEALTRSHDTWRRMWGETANGLRRANR